MSKWTLLEKENKQMKGKLHFKVHFSGERDAGLLPFDDEVIINWEIKDTIEEDDGEFEEMLTQTVKDYFDGCSLEEVQEDAN